MISILEYINILFSVDLLVLRPFDFEELEIKFFISFGTEEICLFNLY
jgi:hypothetical protein